MHRRRSLVAGGSGGLGAAVARELAARGRRVCIHYRTGQSAAEALAGECVAAGGEAITVGADLRCRRDAVALLEDCASRCGGPPEELVVAVGGTSDAPLLRTSEDVWNAVIAANLSLPAWLLQAACQRWRSRIGGHAVLLGSYAGVTGRAHAAAYSAGKAALVGLARSVARELGSCGVRVNVVIPPFVPEGMGAAASPAFDASARKGSVLQTAGSAEELATFIGALLDSERISGQVLTIDSRIPQ